MSTVHVDPGLPLGESGGPPRLQAAVAAPEGISFLARPGRRVRQNGCGAAAYARLKRTWTK